jgi:ATP-dependent DNA ligase
LIWRNGHAFKTFHSLSTAILNALRGRNVVLDGEIVCLDHHGKSVVSDLLFRREEPRFYVTS